MEKIKCNLNLTKQYDKGVIKNNLNRIRKKYRTKRGNNLNNLDQLHNNRVITTQANEIIETAPSTTAARLDQVHSSFNDTFAQPSRHIEVPQADIGFAGIDSCPEIEELEVESEKQHGNKFDNDFLFESSATTVDDFLMCLLSIKFKHKLNTSTCNDILKLIKMILPSPNKCPINSSSFDLLFDDSLTGTVYDICIACNKVTTEQDIKKRHCQQCDKVLNQFFTCNYQPQVVQVLSKPNFIQQVINSNKRGRSADNKLHDAIDGGLYKEAVRNIPSDQLCVSLNINTDGAPLATSVSLNLWPMLASILELEPMSRESFKNMIFLGKYTFLKAY
jgi:hypothetical protein